MTFTHQPASGYFGFQLGEGANNKNGNYGFSQWMYYTGMFGGMTVSGSGDIFGDLDCCLPYDLGAQLCIVSIALATTTTFDYTVRLTGEDCDQGNEGDISDPEDAQLVSVKDLSKSRAFSPTQRLLCRP